MEQLESIHQIFDYISLDFLKFDTRKDKLKYLLINYPSKGARNPYCS